MALARLRGERVLKCNRCTHEWVQRSCLIQDRADAFCDAVLDRLGTATFALALVGDREKLRGVVKAVLFELELRPRCCPGCHSFYWDAQETKGPPPGGGWRHKLAPKPKS